MINKNMSQFPITYTIPMGKIAIGWGVHETVADECKGLNIKNALIVTSGLKGTGIVDEINRILTTNDVATVIYDKVTSNPKDHEVMEAYEVFKEAGCDGVVSVGGGSSHDCAKQVRLVYANDGRDICDFAVFRDKPWMEVMAQFKPPTIPQISVNTTGGTGAESTGAAMCTSGRLRAKIGMLNPAMVPQTALVDPLLIRLMPENITAWTGFDAFAHGFESYLSRINSNYTTAISLKIIKMISENLREFTYNRMNHSACEQICWAENMATATLHLGGGAGIVHGIAHQIGAVTDAHHGHLNASVTIPLERFNQASSLNKFAEMAEAMGVDTRGMTKWQAADKWFDEVESLLKDLKIQTGHLNEQFGLQEKDLGHIVNIFTNDWCAEGNPTDCSPEDCLRLLKDML